MTANSIMKDLLWWFYYIRFAKENNCMNNSSILHCVKSVDMRSYFWSVFSSIQSKHRKIRTRNNSVFENFSRIADVKKHTYQGSSSFNWTIFGSSIHKDIFACLFSIHNTEQTLKLTCSWHDQLIIFWVKYSRMDQVTFVENRL